MGRCSITGYVRQRDANIVNGGVGNASDVKAEFDQVQLAFNATTGHKHDGSTGEGVPITVTGAGQDYIFDPLFIKPKITATYDLGSSSFRFKDGHFSGTVSVAALTASGAISAASGTIGGVAITTATNTQTLTGKSINFETNTVTMTSAQLATALTDETGTGANVFAGSPALTGTPTAPTAAAATNTTQIATTAHVFAERSNTATLTNKTLTSPTINGGTISGITDLAIVDGGTGASDAPTARANLLVSIEKIAKGTLSSAAEFPFLVPSGMDGIEIIVEDVVPSTNNGQLSVQVGTGTLESPTWITAANYSVSAIFQSSAAPNFINVTQNTFTLSTQVKTAGILPNIAKMRAYGFNGSAGINVLFDAIGVIDVAGTPTNQSINGGGRLQTPNNYTLCRLLPLTGTVSCRYTVMGYRK